MDEIVAEKTSSGTKVFVNGHFAGWKCNHCIRECKCVNKYGVCTTLVVTKE